MKGRKPYLFLVISTLLWSCLDQYKETMRVISVSSFTTLQINSVFSVYLVQDTVYLVRIVADDNVVNQVEARVDGEVLYLTDNNDQKWLNPENNKVRVYVHSPAHARINAQSSYSLYSTNTITSDQLVIINDGPVKLSEIDLNLDCNFFYYWNNYLAGGRLKLSGKCGDIAIGNFALHLVNTVDLKAQSGYVKSYSKADCKIYVTEKLECDLHGTGNIYVYGNPSEIIVNEHTSSGQVIRVN